METKIIPFDLETAKKIQAGEIAGAIKTKNGLYCKIVSYCDGTDFFVERKTEAGYCRWCYPYTKDGRYIDGNNNGGTDYDLVIELLEEAPKHEFKPFDKVLVRKNGFDKWKANFFSHMDDGYYKCVNSRYKECVLFEGNEHLVGTTDKPKELC